MKSQSDQTSLSSEQDNLTLENLFSQEYNQYATLQCSGGNQGLDYCFNEKCKQKSVFICGIRDCECRRKHKMCQKGCIESTVNHINSKIYDSKTLDDRIVDKFDQFIDKISDLRERVISKVQSQFKLLLLGRNQRQFLRKIKQHEFSNIKSQELNNVWKAIQTAQEKNIDLFDEGNKLLESFEQNLINQITKFEQSWNDKIYDLNYEHIQTIERIKKKSSILINDELIDRLLKFFPKRVKSIKQLYKASKENFSVEKYFQLCGKEKNTVIIAETTMGKILGAFTPLSMLGSPKFMGQYIADPEGKSFLFSLSQNDKFTLRNRERAINLSPSHDAIRFGNAEFKIIKKTPMQRYNGLSYLTNRYYHNDKYKPNREGYQKLNGNENEEFMTKEWEVWKVDFDEKPKKDDEKPESDLDEEDKSIVFEDVFKDGSILY